MNSLSIRTANSLRAAGLHTPDQLRALLARNQPGIIPNIGKKSLNELRDWLATDAEQFFTTTKGATK